MTELSAKPTVRTGRLEADSDSLVRQGNNDTSDDAPHHSSQEISEYGQAIMESIFQSTPVCLAYLDKRSYFVRMNAAFSHHFEHDGESLLGTHLLQLFSGHEQQTACEKALSTNQIISFQTKPYSDVKHPDLGVTYWDCTLVPDKDSDGGLRGWVLSMLDVTERTRTENKLKQSEERFRLVADYTNGWEMWTGPDGDVRYVSPACEEITGYTPAQFLADPGLLRRIVHFDDLYILDEHLQEGTQFHEKRVVDFRILHRNGAELWISHSCRPIFADDGTWLGYRSSHRDISDRKQAEQALRESEIKLRALIDMLPVGISVLDEFRNIQLVNPALASILHLSVEQLRSGAYEQRRYYRIDGSEMPIDSFPSTLAFVENKPVRDVEIKVETIDGMRIWTSVTAIPLSFKDWRVILTTRDITNQKQAQLALIQAHDELELRVNERTRQLLDLNAVLSAEIAERQQVEANLRASEERFRQVAENINQILWLTDPKNGQFLYVNPIYERIWGQSLDAVSTGVEVILDHVHPEDRESMVNLLKSWEPMEEEVRIVRSDGEVRWLSCHAFPLLNEEGELYRLAGISEDITEKKLALEALVEAEKFSVAGKMATSLAHEINNPLQAAIGCLELAVEQLDKGEDAHEYLQVTAEALTRASRIVRQLRSLHQYAIPEVKVPADMNALVEKVLILTTKKCNDAGITMILEKDFNLPVIHAMPNALQQVFLNLVLNAIDAMPNGGRLRVLTSRTESPPGCQIQFYDQGPGIPAATLERLFEPFQTTKKDSLGLGLFISRSIVQQHGGQITASSQGGQGSVFSVWLPWHEPV